MAINRRENPDKHVWCVMVTERRLVWDRTGDFLDAAGAADGKQPGDTSRPYWMEYSDNPAMAPHAGGRYYFEDQHELVSFAGEFEDLGYKGPSFGWERFLEKGPYVWMCHCGRGVVVCVNGHPRYKNENSLCLKCCDEGRSAGFGCPETRHRRSPVCSIGPRRPGMEQSVRESGQGRPGAVRLSNRCSLSLIFTHMTQTTCDRAARWVEKLPSLCRQARWFTLGTYLLIGTLGVSAATKNLVGICLSVIGMYFLLIEMVNLNAEVYSRVGMAEKHLDICLSPTCAL